MLRKEKGIVFKRCDETDVENLVSLLARVFNGWFGLNHWYWKYKVVEKSMGKSATAWVAEKDGRLIGHVGAIPLKIRVRDTVYLAYQVVDAATEVEYRRRGIFKTLLRKLVEEAKESGFNLLVSFPSIGGASYRNFIASGFTLTSRLSSMFKILDYLKLVRKLLCLNRDTLDRETVGYLRMDGIQVAKVQGVDERLKEIYDQYKRLNNVVVERTIDYLNWRYMLRPDADYELFIATADSKPAGYLISRETRTNFRIGPLEIRRIPICRLAELVWVPEYINAAKAMLALAARSFNRTGLMGIWTSDHRLMSLLRDFGFHSLSREYAFVTLWLDGEEEIENEMILLCMGDTDMV